jgi:RNA polymerase-binding protein DksA
MTRAEPGFRTPDLSKRAAPARKGSSGGSAGAKKPKPSAKPGPAPKKPAPKPAPKVATKPPAAGPKASAPGKPVRKGITIVTPKPVKKAPAKKPTLKLPTFGKPLLGPGGTIKKPLITSGPNAPSPNAMLGGNDKKPRKSPFDKRELSQFKAILLRKRAELVGDVSTMETEALMGQSGSLSHLPQHMAEQGSDAYGQSLSLDLAAADRRLIKEIDDALKRIEDGTYGVCELTGKPIKVDRLEELPWARYSIEAARELERRGSVL